MQANRKKRMYLIIFIILGVSLAAALALYALKQNINLYLTPKQVFVQKIPHNKVFRIGGFVVKHSIHKDDKSLRVNFKLTDHKSTIKVNYDGILPSLFRAGQGIVVQGRLKNGVFVADQVLAKHDATYKPPGLS